MPASAHVELGTQKRTKHDWDFFYSLHRSDWLNLSADTIVAICKQQTCRAAHTVHTLHNQALLRFYFYFSRLLFVIFHLILFDRPFASNGMHRLQRNQRRRSNRKWDDRYRRRKRMDRNLVRCRDVLYSIHMCTIGRAILITSAAALGCFCRFVILFSTSSASSSSRSASSASASSTCSSSFLPPFYLPYLLFEEYLLPRSSFLPLSLCEIINGWNYYQVCLWLRVFVFYACACACAKLAAAVTDEWRRLTRNLTARTYTHSLEQFANQNYLHPNWSHTHTHTDTFAANLFVFSVRNLFSSRVFRFEWIQFRNQMRLDACERCLFVLNIKFWLTTSLCVQQRSDRKREKRGRGERERGRECSRVRKTYKLRYIQYMCAFIAHS